MPNSRYFPFREIEETTENKRKKEKNMKIKIFKKLHITKKQKNKKQINT